MLAPRRQPEPPPRQPPGQIGHDGPGGVGDEATTGVWTRVNPIGTAAQPEDDHTKLGTVCWVTGQGSPGGGLGENDVDGGQTTLTSPTFDLDGAAHAVVSYWRWYSNDTGGGPNADVFVVDISNDNGVNWTNVETIGPAGPGTSGGWIFHGFDVADFLAQFVFAVDTDALQKVFGQFRFSQALDVVHRDAGPNRLAAHLERFRFVSN